MKKLKIYTEEEQFVLKGFNRSIYIMLPPYLFLACQKVNCIATADHNSLCELIA